MTIAFAVALLLQTQGYASDTSADATGQLLESTNQVSNILFGPVVRKIALTLGFGAGLFQAFMSGSIKPLLIYGGLGLAVCLLPRVIDLISSL